MTDKRRCFMQWFVLFLGYALAAFFAYHYGLLQFIWKTDLTYMTSVIGSVFVITAIYLGVGSWRYGSSSLAYVNADARLGAQVSSMVVLIGMLGTVIGLMYQLKAMTGLTDITQITGFVADLGRSLGSAFFATACGITASVGIKLMVANIDYFLDVEAE